MQDGWSGEATVSKQKTLVNDESNDADATNDDDGGGGHGGGCRRRHAV